MHIKSPLFVLAAVSAIALATGALADSDDSKDKNKVEKKHVAVFINKEDDNSDAKIKLKINGESWKFELPKLSDGEERIIATEDGRTVKAKRTGKEVTIEAGGETVKLPAEGHGMHVRFHGVPPVPPVAPVPELASLERLTELRDTVIISGVGLTEEQQKKVREAIKKAGIDKPVKFVQGGQHVMVHGAGPMNWTEHGDGKTVRTMVITKDGGETDDIEAEVEIEAIRKVDQEKGGTQ